MEVMRVHPSILGAKSKKWQFPAAVGLLLFLLIVNLVRGPGETVVAQPAQPTEKKIEVVVVRSLIQTGQPIDKANLALEQRPVSTLPSDAITSFEALQNKVAAGPIPAGYPLAVALLADPIAVVPVDDRVNASPPEDPIETLLKEIEQETVALSLNFTAASPARGSRIAVTLASPRGESAVVIEDCWVSKASGREAVLRVEPNQALLLQSIKGYGNFSFIEIPTEGQSPYAGKGVKTQDEVARAMGVDTSIGKVVAKDPSKKNMKGYAWVAGEGVRYGLDDEGNIKVVTPND